jgi:triosephosphate isomerase (TIM)
MRNFLIVGNWKMHTDVRRAEGLVGGLAADARPAGVEVVVCPPVVFLERCATIAQEKSAGSLAVGTQNISWEKEGAITGDIGINMVKAWAKYVIIGHSERRKYFAESNSQVVKKMKLALDAHLTPILCVGEKRFMTGDVAEVGKEMMEGMPVCVRNNCAGW